MPLDRGSHQHDEGAGGAADLEPASAQQRHQEAADDGGEKPPVRRNAGCDRDRHRQRQGHDGDGQSGYGVGAKIREPVAFAQDGDKLGGEQFREGRFGGPDGHGGAFFCRCVEEFMKKGIGSDISAAISDVHYINCS